MADLPSTLNRKQWAEKITERYHDSVRAILDVGRYLIQAKAELPHGEFGCMIAEDLPFSRQTAFRLMVIARNPVLSNETHGHHLPASWGTLYELTKVPVPILDAALSTGQITPDFQRKDVPLLLPAPPAPLPQRETAVVTELTALTRTGKTFGTLYVNPPWPAGPPSQPALLETLAALPIADLAADNAHLHLWTTDAFLFECQSLLETWQFVFKSALVWVKPQAANRTPWQRSHEFLLLGVHGHLPFRDHNQLSWFQAEEVPNGGKPEAVRAMIELVSPGPYLELFRRAPVAGWTVWEQTGEE